MKSFDDNILAQIEAYIQGEMTPEEIIAFENSLSDNPDLREELNLQQSLHNSFRDTNNNYDEKDLLNPNVQDVIHQIKSDKYQSISSNIKLVNNQYQNDKVNVISLQKRNYFLFSTAIVIALIICSIFLFNNGNDNLDFVYKEYAVHNDIHLVEKSKNTIPSATIEKQFNNKDYYNAYTSLSNYVKSNPTSTKAKLAFGICALETEKTEVATEIFQTIMNGNSSFKHYGTWYLALIEVKTGNIKNAKSLLNKIPKSEHQIYIKAKEILKKI